MTSTGLEGVSVVDIASPQLINLLEHESSDSDSDREEINVEHMEDEDGNIFDLFD